MMIDIESDIERERERKREEVNTRMQRDRVRLGGIESEIER